LQEFKLNPNAKSFIPSQSPLRAVSPVNDGSFYYPAAMPAMPHMQGMPVGMGVSSRPYVDLALFLSISCFGF